MTDTSPDSDVNGSGGAGAESALFDKGAQIRSQVLGAEHVARSGGMSYDTANDLQRLVTELGWGTVWTRGVFELKTRSFITVAMLIALDRPHELRIHLRGARNNGATEQELRELVIHAIPYCGFPAALDAMRHVDELLAETAPAAPAASAAPAAPNESEATR